MVMATNGTSLLENLTVDGIPNTVMVFDDKDHHNSVLDNLNQLRKSRQFCDVILQVGNQENEIHEIFAHKVVLSSASPYLLELFSSSDSTEGVQQLKLWNHFYDIEAFECVVDYAYTARLEVPKDKVKEVYAIATKLKMNSIAYHCGQYLLSTLTPENCLRVRAIRGVLSDQFLLNSVDGYVRQNIVDIVQSKCLDSLDKVQVEVLLNSEEERAVINSKHVFDMVMEWIRRSFDREELKVENLCEKMFMLYLNKADKCLHDCNEIESGTNDDSDLIQDYKRESRRLSFPAKSGLNNNGNGSGTQSNGGESAVKAKTTHQNGKKAKSGLLPAKSNRFLFTRSDSESSLSSLADDDNENDWKVVAVCSSGKHSLIGLTLVSGKLYVLTVKLRVNSPMHSPTNTRHNSLEKPELYCLIPPMSCARCAVGTAELNGKLIVCGGYDRGECLRTVEVYDESTNKMDKLNTMLVPRGRFDITVIDGDVYAIGGSDGQNELNSAEMYDSKSQTWTPIPNCPIVRSNAGVCSIDGKVYVIGGWNGQRGLTRCDVFDPKTQHWNEVQGLNTGRYQTGVAVLDRVIYAVGGCDSWTCLNSAEMYCDNSWQMIAPLHTARRGCGVAAFNGKIYAIGGHDGVHALCSVEVYDPSTDSWSAGPSLTNCRANVGVAVVGKRLYAVGGFNGKVFLNTIEYLDLEANEWTSSVIKANIDGNAETNSAKNQRERNKKEMNGRPLTDLSSDSMSGVSDGYNYSIHSNPKKVSLNTTEALVEVEETTVGH